MVRVSGGSRLRAHPPVPDDDDDFEADEYLNEFADYDEEPQAPQQQPQQQPQQPNVEEEGYPEGPRDLSLLKDYHKHRPIPIWDAQADDPMLNKYLRCIASANKVIKLQKPHPNVAWFWGPGIASRLEPLVRTNFNVLDYVGKFLYHRKMTRPEEAQMVSSFLGIDEEDALEMFATLNGPHMKHSYVAGLFSQYQTAADRDEAENRPVHEIRLYRERCIRAFLLFVSGCTIFSNRSSYYLDIVYLQYFQDLSSVHEWNWGSATLVHLKNYLDYASEAGSSQMAGYMSLLEEWIITHFPALSMWQFVENVTDDMPLNAKCGNLKAKHLPECVLRQFKYVQGIPRNSDMSATPNINVFEIDRVFAEELELRMIDEHMRGQPVVNAWDHEPRYIRWLYRVSHPKMRPSEVSGMRLRKELQFIVLCVGFSACLTRV
ncbi:hypothetical protein TSUD_54860 [Trifolium subterraneum]|uniref:Aminotransferase-like plant mobile domain-containing protein n=1 Tax=Trifolium subterraneum TaxID=3900 RepID=A0A2Z6M7J6_TRISU|nr:hypothetical protein TSUD_54860 [Trifolium subterraneum]